MNSLKESEVAEDELLDAIALLDTCQTLEANGWKPKFEELNPPLHESVPSHIEAPKLELKQLPSELKYAFLGPDDT